MYIYQLQRQTRLSTDLATAWDFFSSPDNLNALTPDDLQFEILSDISGVKMFAGMIINYRIQPFPGVRMRWTTEISQCSNLEYFVDEQRFGPYAFWHHLHKFEQKDGYVLMTDLVHYALPFGILGRISQPIFIGPKLANIFAFREKKVSEIFG